MVTPEEAQFLFEAVQPLAKPLHEVLPAANDAAEAHFTEHDMTAREYAPGRAHLARCHAHKTLSDLGPSSLGGWEVASKGPNVRLWLVRETLRMRLLRPMIGTQVPPPGRNAARTAYYRQQLNLYDVAGSDLIGVWDVNANAHEALIRIVRPIGTWKLGRNEKVDVDFWLPSSSNVEMEFRPTDDLGLFLPEEEGEDGQGAEGGEGK